MPQLRAHVRALAALALEIVGVATAVFAVALWNVPSALLLLGGCLVLAAVALQNGGVL